MNEVLKANKFKSRRSLIFVLLIIFIAFLPTTMPRELAENYSYLIDISAFVCLVLSIRIFQVHKMTEFRWIGKFFAMAMGLWLLGELNWTIYEDFFGIEPFPSLADLFWFAGYVPFLYLILRILYLYRKFINTSSIKKITVIWIFLNLIFLGYLGSLIFNWDETLLVKIISFSYPLLDSLALLFLVLLLVTYRNTTLEIYWWIFTFGMLFDVFGDYLFAYYEAFGLYFVSSLPDSFFLLSYLTIILGFAMILKTKTIFSSIEPLYEDFANTHQKYELEKGEAYLVEKVDKAYEILKDLSTHAIHGLCISRDRPEKLRKKYGIERIPIFWLARVDSEVTIKPTSLEKIIYLVNDYTKKSRDSVVILSGIEYLITYNDFFRVLRFLYNLKEIIKKNKSRLIISIDKSILDEEQWEYINREFSVFDS
ncbi:MAG: DUF835 domain-containing protein [Candidatus Methanofastidiosia archaeon]